MRTAIYARFSTELQQERSIVQLCRAYAAKNGLDVVGAYDDRRATAHRFLAVTA